MAYIFQHIFNRPARYGTPEERLRREHVHEEDARRIAEELVRREQERRARSEQLLRGFPPVQSLGPHGRFRNDLHKLGL